MRRRWKRLALLVVDIAFGLGGADIMRQGHEVDLVRRVVVREDGERVRGEASRQPFDARLAVSAESAGWASKAISKRWPGTKRGVLAILRNSGHMIGPQANVVARPAGAGHYHSFQGAPRSHISLSIWCSRAVSMHC